VHLEQGEGQKSGMVIEKGKKGRDIMCGNRRVSRDIREGA
jgi:hypothetical protein